MQKEQQQNEREKKKKTVIQLMIRKEKENSHYGQKVYQPRWPKGQRRRAS